MTTCVFGAALALLSVVFGKVYHDNVSSRASICYDINRRASLALHCPGGLRIASITAFSALSETRSCSFQPSDCVVHRHLMTPRLRLKCLRQSHCTLTVVHRPTARWRGMCDGAGDVHYLQAEFVCAERGVKHIQETEVDEELRVTYRPPSTEHPLLTVTEEPPWEDFDPLNDTTIQEWDVVHLDQSTTSPSARVINSERMDEDLNPFYNEDDTSRQPDYLIDVFDADYTLVLTVAGGILGFVLVMALVVTLIKRIKNRSYNGDTYRSVARRRARQASRRAARPPPSTTRSSPARHPNYQLSPPHSRASSVYGSVHRGAARGVLPRLQYRRDDPTQAPHDNGPDAFSSARY